MSQSIKQGIHQIICLSLKSDTDRRKKFIDVFSDCNIPITFHDGIDGRQQRPTVPDWVSLISHSPLYSSSLRSSLPVLNQTITDTELACVLGHMEIWKQVAEAPHNDYFLICEDDAEPKTRSSFSSSLDLILTEMTSNEFVYLGYSSGLIDKRNYRTLRWIWHFLKNTMMCPTLEKRFQFNRSMRIAPTNQFRRKHLKRAGQHWGAFSYLINSQIATILLELNRDLEMTSDGTFRYAALVSAIKTSVASPGLIIVDGEFQSNIRSQEEHERSFAKKNLFG